MRSPTQTNNVSGLMTLPSQAEQYSKRGESSIVETIAEVVNRKKKNLNVGPWLMERWPSSHNRLWF